MEKQPGESQALRCGRADDSSTNIKTETVICMYADFDLFLPYFDIEAYVQAELH
jgi:hypothetical protein